MDKGEKNDKMSITKVSVRNIEDRIISARVTGLMKVFADVLLFISNLYILNGELGSNLHRKLSIYQLSAYNKFNIFYSVLKMPDSTVQALTRLKAGLP